MECHFVGLVEIYDVVSMSRISGRLDGHLLDVQRMESIVFYVLF